MTGRMVAPTTLTLAQVRAVLVRLQQNAEHEVSQHGAGTLRRAHAQGAASAYETALEIVRTVAQVRVDT